MPSGHGWELPPLPSQKLPAAHAKRLPTPVAGVKGPADTRCSSVASVGTARGGTAARVACADAEAAELKVKVPSEDRTARYTWILVTREACCAPASASSKAGRIWESTSGSTSRSSRAQPAPPQLTSTEDRSLGVCGSVACAQTARRWMTPDVRAASSPEESMSAHVSFAPELTWTTLRTRPAAPGVRRDAYAAELTPQQASDSDSRCMAHACASPTETLTNAPAGMPVKSECCESGPQQAIVESESIMPQVMLIPALKEENAPATGGATASGPKHTAVPFDCRPHIWLSPAERTRSSSGPGPPIPTPTLRILPSGTPGKPQQLALRFAKSPHA